MRSLAKQYYVAKYLRLSKEDGKAESQSIQTQREMLDKYIKDRGWRVVDEYVDDGYSGTDFDRPDFKRLISDIEIGKINLVVVKDLSRLGRNYIDLGKIMEELFPKHDIRLIAVNDGYDSIDERASDFAPLKNYFNEMYAKDTSRKIRSILNMKAQNGEPRNTVFPIFGYNYNEAYERIPDPETGPIVQLIYKKVIELGSSGLVAKYLTREKIKTPRYYNAVKFNYNKVKVLSMPESKLYTWTAGMVRDIITREEYLGVYKTAQTSSLSFKLKKRYHNKNCYVFENRYEPLIDRSTWDMAQKMIKEARGSSVQLEDNPFRGIVYCEDCGKKMRLERRPNNGVLDYRYYCNKSDCDNPNSITRRVLETIVARDLLELKDYILSKEKEFLEYASKFDCTGRDIKTDIETEIVRLKNKCQEVDKYIEKLFEQNIQGNLPNSTFTTMMSKYKREKDALENEIKILTRRHNAELQNPTNQLRAHELVDFFKTFDETTVIQSNVIQKLIRRIGVRARMANGSKHQRIFDLRIQYYSCDNIIKGFLTYE